MAGQDIYDTSNQQNTGGQQTGQGVNVEPEEPQQTPAQSPLTDPQAAQPLSPQQGFSADNTPQEAPAQPEPLVGANQPGVVNQQPQVSPETQANYQIPPTEQQAGMQPPQQEQQQPQANAQSDQAPQQPTDPAQATGAQALSVDSVMVYPSRVVLIFRLITFTLIAYILLVIFGIIFEPIRNALVGAVIYGVLVLIIIVQWLARSYEIKPGHIIFNYKGPIKKSGKTYSLNGIESIDIKQGFFGTRFNYGDINLTKTEFRENESLPGITDPQKTMAVIQEAAKQIETAF